MDASVGVVTPEQIVIGAKLVRQFCYVVFWPCHGLQTVSHWLRRRGIDQNEVKSHYGRVYKAGSKRLRLYTAIFDDVQDFRQFVCRGVFTWLGAIGSIDYLIACILLETDDQTVSGSY